MTKRKEKAAENPGDPFGIKPSKPSGSAAPKPNESADPVPASSETEAVPVEVERHAEGRPSLLGRLLATPSRVEGEPQAPPKPKRGRPRKDEAPRGSIRLSVRDLSDMLSLLGAYLVSRWDIPEAAKPTERHISAFTEPLAAILNRHLPAFKGSDDAMDILRMFLAGYDWFIFARPALAEAMKEKEGATDAEVVNEVEPVPGANGRESGATPTSAARVGLVAGSG